MAILSKFPKMGLTIFSKMSKLAADCNAVNLSQGYPDFNPDSDLLEHVQRAMNEGFNEYSPMQGAPSLQDAIANQIMESYAVKIEAAHQEEGNYQDDPYPG